MLRFSIHHTILVMGRLSSPTVCHIQPPYSATILVIDIFQHMALLESPYNIRDRAFLDAGNVPLAACLLLDYLRNTYIFAYTFLDSS